MNKFQATIDFEWDDSLADLLTPHRTYINKLILEGVIDHYAVTMESQRIWITLNAESKDDVDIYLSGSPLYKYWVYQVDELYVIDGMQYRLPIVQLN